MEKIGILTCLHSNDVCARVGCLSSFWQRKDFFAKYAEDTILAAMLTCNGCKENKLPNQEGMAKKVERIKKLNPDALHLSNCTMPKDEGGNRVICPVIKELEDEFVAAGINVVYGTH